LKARTIVLAFMFDDQLQMSPLTRRRTRRPHQPIHSSDAVGAAS
jgi:hypothetical protein